MAYAGRVSRRLVVKCTAGADDLERLSQALTVSAVAATSGVPVSLWLTGDSVLLAVPGLSELPRQMLRDMNDRPLLHFAARDGVTHSLWAVHDPAPYEEMFRGVERVYIADGHHRSAAADRADRAWRAFHTHAAAPKWSGHS